jgi:hypothetical protein
VEEAAALAFETTHEPGDAARCSTGGVGGLGVGQAHRGLASSVQVEQVPVVSQAGQSVPSSAPGDVSGVVP